MSKKVLITGASAGFGYGAAKALAKKGHTVYATMRGVSGKNATAANELSSFASDNGYNLSVYELDVTDEASIEAAVGKAIEAGGIDVVINNAGFGVGGVQESLTIEQVQQVFDVNVFGIFRMNRAVLPYLRKQGSGRIIYISSGLGRILFPFFGPYNATKFAVEALAETAHYELSPLGIETQVIQPGAYGTSFFNNVAWGADQARTAGYGPVQGMMQGFFAGFEEQAKAGQMGDPQEVVDAMVDAVEAEPGALPLRRPVGNDVGTAVAAINEVCANVQDQLFEAFGLK